MEKTSIQTQVFTGVNWKRVVNEREVGPSFDHTRYALGVETHICPRNTKDVDSRLIQTIRKC